MAATPAEEAYVRGTNLVGKVIDKAVKNLELGGEKAKRS
jgi:hypothetical protein